MSVQRQKHLDTFRLIGWLDKLEGNTETTCLIVGVRIWQSCVQPLLG